MSKPELDTRTFHGNRLRSSEWVHYHEACDGVELFEAAFEHHVYERHIHETYAIGVTHRGIQRFWCRGTTYDSVTGDVIVIPPGAPHDGESGAAGGYSYRMFYLSEEAMADVVSDAFGRPGSNIRLRRACVIRQPDLARRLDALWDAMSAQPTSLAAEELFRQTFPRLDVRHDAELRAAHTLDERALKRVRDYLCDHVYDTVSLQDLAALTSMSRFQLTRQFQKAYGLPLHAYHVHLRLREARRLLRTGMPIAAVATELGFVDQSHLHRRFKGAFGLTPGAWRHAAARRSKTR